MNLINNVVEKIFGEEQIPSDYNHPDFAKKVFENAPSLISRYHECTPEQLINECLFEYTEVAQELKKYMDKVKLGYER
jgi:hypothetical protein